ncbi:hypothetical protein D3C81_2207840 [compost metagenome]
MGVRVSRGLPPPAARASRKAWVVCSTPGLSAAKAWLTDRASRLPATRVLIGFMASSSV